MRTLCLIFLLCALSLEGQKRYLNPLFDSKAVDEPISSLRLIDATSRGNNYLSTNWYIGVIELKNGDRFENFFIRYEMVRHEFDIIVGRKIKIVRGQDVASFEWFNTEILNYEVFVNTDAYGDTEVNEEIRGFFKVLTSGDLEVLNYTHVIFYKAASNPSLVSQEDELATLETTYLAKGKVLHDVKRKSDVFGEYKEEVEQYMKENDLRLRSDRDLVKIVDFYNELAGS